MSFGGVNKKISKIGSPKIKPSQKKSPTRLHRMGPLIGIMAAGKPISLKFSS